MGREGTTPTEQKGMSLWKSFDLLTSVGKRQIRFAMCFILFLCNNASM